MLLRGNRAATAGANTSTHPQAKKSRSDSKSGKTKTKKWDSDLAMEVPDLKPYLNVDVRLEPFPDLPAFKHLPRSEEFSKAYYSFCKEVGSWGWVMGCIPVLILARTPLPFLSPAGRGIDQGPVFARTGGH